ncbi:MAG: fatty acid cis/trans isomerase [Proteobacteria bacterium]|nr:fatty acid cis/trans isomerase [Pseudomonadota bacterium]
MLRGIFLAGCVANAIGGNAIGPAAPAPDYQHDIRPLLERRCLVCHGCYDAPCQLKLDSHEGLTRGASKERVYSTDRLVPAAPSRLFEDAQTTAQWRAHGFSPVLPDQLNASEADRRAGVLARMLDLKRENPLPAGKLLPKTFDFSLNRAQQCPRVDEFNTFASRYPQWGMPFGLPPLTDSEYHKVTEWLAADGRATEPAPLSPTLAKEVEYWESLFNGDSLKHQLAARYVYEHLFLAHLYLEDRGANTVFFKVVRSRTPPGVPLDLITTRRPYDDPGVSRVYYRLWRDPASVVAKTHMPYQLTAARRDRWRKWFIDADYKVDRLPGYDPRTASNPFVTFERIPYASRHSFLLDEAQFTIMNFIKGPVCRGSVALSVIQDRFWVFFTSPQSAVGQQFAQFLAKEDEQLELPAAAGSGIWSATKWRSYARAQSKYLQAKGDFIRANAAALDKGGLSLFWDGEGTNANAALTVFRHNDSATVVQGLVGTPPQTAWLIDYPILERIHYLLVAGFDVYGTASHQLMTRMYMDFLRMESEMNFLGFLPQDARIAEVRNWYRGADRSVQAYLDSYYQHGVLAPPMDFKTDRPKAELFRALELRLAKVLNHRYELQKSGLTAQSIASLARLDQVRGVAASILPQAVIMKVNGHGLLTLLSNSAYSNISSLLNAAGNRLPAEDTLTIVNGVSAAYPNAFLELNESDIPELVTRIEQIRSEADYAALLDRYGIRRTDERFWKLSDQVLADYQNAEPISHGVLDYSRYENR